jgi:hypothetical protein
VIGAGDPLEVAPPGVDRLHRVLADLDGHDSSVFDLKSADIGDDGGAGGRLDLSQPVVERLLADGHPANGTVIRDTNQHGSPLGIGKGHQRFDGLPVKRGLEFDRIRLAGTHQGVNVRQQDHIIPPNLKSRSASVSHSFPPRDLENRQKNNFNIQEKRTMQQIILVKFHLFRNRNIVPAVNLRPPRDPWN